MIANITSGENFTGVVLYNENKVSKGEAEKLFTNMPSDNKKDMITFLEKTTESFVGNISKPTFHVSISLANSDRLTANDFNEVATKYLDAMGYGNSPYVVYRHFDRDHDHIHIVSTRINLDGQRVSDSNERYRSQKITRDLELQYGLKIVSSLKDETQEPYLSDASSIAVNTGAVKDQIRRVTDFVLQQLKPLSFKAFQDELKARNIEVREQKHDQNYNKLKKRGLVYHLRGLDEKRQTKGISGSAFSGRFSSTRIEEQIENNVKERIPAVKDRFTALINTVSTKEEVPYHLIKSQLQLIGFEPLFSRNSAGVYGMNFREVETDAVFKASDIHKILSWHTIKYNLPNEDFRALNLGAEPLSSPSPITNTKETEAKLELQKAAADQYKKPIATALRELSRRGVYTKQEFAEGLAKTGVVPVYSTNSGGIYGLSFEVLQTGQQFKASSLGKGYSWNDLSKNIFETDKPEALTTYIEQAFSVWRSDSKGRLRTQNDFLIHLNRFGLTLANTSEGLNIGRLVPQDDQTYKIENNIKITDLIDGDLYTFFNIAKGSLSGEVRLNYQAKGVAAAPLTQLERKLIESWREGNRDAVLEAYKLRTKIHLSADERSESTLLNAEKTLDLGVKLDRYLIPGLLKSPDIYSHPFNLVRYMNRRGISVRPERDKSGKVADIRFVKAKGAFIRLSELNIKSEDRAMLTNLQKDILAHFNSLAFQTIDLRNHLSQNEGFLFAHDKQLESFFEALDTNDRGAFKTLVSRGLDYRNLTTSDDPERAQIHDFIRQADNNRFANLPDDYDFEPLSTMFSADENPMNNEDKFTRRRKRGPNLR